MKKLLITGASGFVGQWAMKLFAQYPDWGYEPLAMERVDLRDQGEVERAIQAKQLDAVLHLAAQSFVPRSFDDPKETMEVNAVGTLNLINALQRTGFCGRLLYISSGDVYGRVKDENLPVNELLPTKPRNPYAVSKICAEEMCLQWHRTHQLDVVIARPFNHIGPGQHENFVIPSFARQVMAVHQGTKDHILAGDVDTTRDFLDVRDVVSAYAALLEQGVSGKKYVVASGVERQIRELLHTLCALMDVKADIQVDTERLRPSEQRRMVADASLLRADTGWEPQYSIEQTLSDILNQII